VFLKKLPLPFFWDKLFIISAVGFLITLSLLMIAGVPEWPNGLGSGPSGLVPARVRKNLFSFPEKKKTLTKKRKG